MTTHRLPRAVSDEQAGLEGVLAAVHRTAVDLLAASPVPPSTLNVRAGDVAVEMGWAVGEAVLAPVTPLAAVPAAPGFDPVPGDPVPAGETITAATVGVFYRSPSPGAPPFVAEGDEITRGQQIAIVEAMKLMLPVEADKGGRIAEILVADGEPVEYGQPLFRLAAAGEELDKAA